jgi:hypothetical protein
MLTNSPSKIKEAIDILKGDGEFRGGDPEYAQQKREEAREEEELSASMTPTMERAIAALKAQPGEEAGEFRGGDPELLQQKREEKRAEALESGGGEEEEEEEELDPVEIEEADLEQKERDEDQGKAMPWVAAPVSPIDSLEDYHPRDQNGDLLDQQRRYAQPNIDPAPVRDKKTRHLPWSEVVGFKVPRLGAPWAHLRQYLMVGDVQGAQEEAPKILKAIDGYLSDPEIEKAFFQVYDRLNQGLGFDPYYRIFKARKGEIVPGHKYVFRKMGSDGEWVYDYSGGIHDNHGIAHTGHSQGHSLDVHPEFDHTTGTAEEAFHHARQKQLEEGGLHRFKMTDRETMEPKNRILRIKPGASQGLEIHEDPNPDEEDLTKLKLSAKAAHKGGTQVARMATNWNNFDKFMRTKHVNTENDVDEKPWIHWYLPEATPQKKKTQAQAQQVLDSVGGDHKQAAEALSELTGKEISVKNLKDRLQKPRVQMRWAKDTPHAGYTPKRSEGAWGFQGGTMSAFERMVRLGRAQQSEITGKGEIGKFDLDHDRPMTNMVHAGRFPKTQKKLPYLDEHGNPSTTRKGFRTKMGVDWRPEGAAVDDDRPSKAETVGALFDEHRGLAVSTALTAAKRIDFKRQEMGRETLKELGLQYDFVKQLSSSPETADAFRQAVESYSPYYKVKDPESGEEKPVKFSTFLHHSLRGAMAGQMRQLIDAEFPQVHLDKESLDDPNNKALQTHTGEVINSVEDFHSAQQAALEKEEAARAEGEQRKQEQEQLQDWADEAHHKWDERLKDLEKKVAAGEKEQEDLDNMKMTIGQAKKKINDVVFEGPEAASEFHSLWNEIGSDPDDPEGEQFIHHPPIHAGESVDELAQHLQGQGHHTVSEAPGVDMRHLENVYTGHIHTPLNQLAGHRDLLMDPHLRQRVRSENLNTVGELMASAIDNPVPGPSADAMERVLGEHRAPHPSQSGKEFAPFSTWNTPTTSVLGKAQPQPPQGDVSYLETRGAPGAMQHLYESPDGNIVQGTNAPEDHEHHDPSLGSPEVHPNEPTPETHPNMFDEQGQKLHTPIPEGVDEVETNPDYDPDKNSGNSWVKRYKDPETGDTRHSYLHRDQVLDPKLQRNNDLRYVDAQLPKIRDDYTERLRSDAPEDKAVGLFIALVDQAKLPISFLANLEAGEVTLGEGNVATFKMSHGNVKVALDDRTSEILKELLEDKYDADPVFVVNGHKINIMQINQYLHNFGVTPQGFQTYHTTRLFSQEFQKMVAQEKGDLTISHLREVRHEAAINVGKMLGVSPEEVEHHVDPIAVEALFLAAAVHRHKIAKAHGTCPACHEPWSLCPHTRKKEKFEKGYKLQGKTDFQGLPISIENKKGSVRKWHDPFAKRDGETKMHYDYGYIRGTLGTDGDHVDVYLGPVAEAKTVYVVHQRRAPEFKRFDEDKVMLGFASAKEAKQAYLRQYDNPRFFGNMTALPMETFKEKLQDRKGDMIKSLKKAQAWVVSAHGPSKTDEESSFSRWVHSYPLHEHHVHWNALTRQALAEDSDRHHTNLGVETGTKPDEDPLAPEEEVEE